MHLYAILDLAYVPPERAGEVAAALLRGGADILQLRAKSHGKEMISQVAARVIPHCRATGVPFILNDHPDLAAALDADGVHIGQDDGTLAAARISVGPGKMIGRSTHSPAQALAALDEGFDYIGFGPLFPTPTKAGRPGIGLQDIRDMERVVGSRIPAFCIGGINPESLGAVLAAGARRVAMVSALLTAADVEAATRAVKTRLLRDTD